LTYFRVTLILEHLLISHVNQVFGQFFLPSPAHENLPMDVAKTVAENFCVLCNWLL